MANKQYFSYKGYTGSIEVSTEDLCLFGKIQMIQDLVMYDGEN
ncbi:MAG TPA: toxin-antitoxin system HicB family antitoxin, partial [Psychrobacter sp.]|nr:toxin-antitoxin system HicB family antitoxin [Psychrobacter sp.]